MKKLVIMAFCALIMSACGDSSKDSYYMQLVKTMPLVQALKSAELSGDKAQIENALNNLNALNMPREITEDALELIQRANAVGYWLLLPDELSKNLDSYIIIATLPRGIYNLGLIPNAKHFEFALSPTLNDNGTEWNWEADALSRAQSEFVAFLGSERDAKIIFYDSGEHNFSPMGSANVAIMWAKHLGYTNVSRLVGGFNAWRDLKLPITTQMPHCCEM